MTKKSLEFTDEVAGVVIQKDYFPWESEQSETFQMPLVKIRTRDNTVYTLISPTDVKEGLRYSFFISGNGWKLEDGRIHRDREGGLPIGGSAIEMKPAKAIIQRLDPKGTQSYNWQNMAAGWEMFGAHDLEVFSNAVRATMPDGGVALCRGDEVVIEEPSYHANLAAVLYAHRAWDQKLNVQGPEDFLMNIWDLATDLSVKVANYNPKYAMRGVYSEKLTGADRSHSTILTLQ